MLAAFAAFKKFFKIIKYEKLHLQKHQANFNFWRHKALSNLFVKKMETRVHVQVGQILFFGTETFADLTMEQKSYKLLKK